MSNFDFFSSIQYRKGSVIEFPSSTAQTDCTEWVIDRKLSYLNRQRSEEQVKSGQGTSNVVGTFRVYNRTKGFFAYMRAYLQVPIIGTELLPASDRATQATQASFEEITAVKTFHDHKSTITPALFAISEESQDEDDQGLVPRGFITHFVFESVEGVRLAEDQLRPTLEKPHTFFAKFNREERDHIREVFDDAYQDLRHMGWEPGTPWANNLIWNPDSSKIYFIDFRHPLKKTPRSHSRQLSRSAILEARHAGWEIYGLVIAPYGAAGRNDPTRYFL